MHPVRFLCLMASIDFVLPAFVWKQQPGTVQACVGGTAEFPWQYDDTQTPVTEVYWRFVKTGKTVLAHNGDKPMYYSDDYRKRAARTDLEKANFGLILKNVTLGDAGEYRIELSGPSGGIDVANLIVHEDATPQLLLDDGLVDFGSSNEVDWSSEDLTVALRTGDSVKEMSIQVGDLPEKVCHLKSTCSAVFTPGDHDHRVELTARFRIQQETCPPHAYAISMTPKEGTVSFAASTTAIVVGVLVPVVVIAVIVAVVLIVLKRKKKSALKRKPQKADEDLNATELEVLTKNPDTVPDRPPDIISDTVDYQSKSDADKHEADRNALNDSGDPPPEIESLADLYKNRLDMKELAKLGYYYNDVGELRSIDKDDPFEFNFYPEHSRNQKRYEALGQILDRYIYKFLEERLNLERIYIPRDATDSEPRSFMFASPGAFKKSKLLVLIHGSGVVRAGQWARRLIINNELDSGTQFPYIHWGLRQGYGVVVLNTNLNKDPETSEEIPCCESPEDHACFVWNNFIGQCRAQSIAIVAHSYGGVVVTSLADDFGDDFYSRVFAVAFTDSVHSASSASERTRQYLAQNAINWVSSGDPRDVEQPRFGSYEDAKRVSAGHPRHEWTSSAAMESVFKFLDEKYQQAQNIKDSSC